MKLCKRQTQNRFSNFGLLFFITGLLLLAGCAVLNIDVDIYKGPLANSPDIQTEQVAAMAMGAKPLLVSLRDNAECGYDKTAVSAYAKQDWYRNGFVPPGTNNQTPFTNDLAIRVNEILSLYEDKRSGVTNALVAEARRALNRYRAAYNILHRPQSMDEKLFENLRMPTNCPPAQANANSQEQCELAQAYRLFLVQSNEWREGTNIFKVTNALKGFTRAEDFFGASSKGLSNLPSTDSPSANSWVSALQDSELLKLHANILFPTNASKSSTNEIRKLQDNFVYQVTVVARSFTDARKALAELWQLNLGIISLLDSGTTQSTRQEPPSLAIRSAARLAVSLVQPQYLISVLNDPKAPEAVKGLKRMVTANSIFANRWTESNRLKIFAMDQQGRANIYSDIDQALEKLLMSRPSDTAAALVAADDHFRKNNPDSSDPYFDLPLNREFGLSRGPTGQANRDLSIENIGRGDLVEENLSQIGDTLDGLAGGRINDGLQTAIQNYLQASHDFHSDDHQVRMTRRQLLDALVGFAEKIKFIADNQVLLQRNQRDDYKHAKPYTQILQTVGNSIISQVNELAEQATYDRNSKTVIDPGWHAMTNAYNFLASRAKAGSPAGEANDAPTGKLTASTSNDGHPETPNLFANLPEPGTKKEAFDILITALRDVQISATLTGDTNSASQAKAAIELATSYRTDTIYIRPPSAYLRNSYPATSLQPDANVVWQNMLGRHGLRSLPLIGEAIANRGVDVKAIQEIDKQYWQNINRVRVGAVGITSYAITKDDIGNWYVKSYTGDPTPIIEGAKNLALYGVATSAAAKGAQALTQVAQTSNAPPEPTLLQSQYAHFEAIYATETTNEAWTVYNTATNLTNSLLVAFGTNLVTSTETNIVVKYYDLYLTNAVTQLTNSLAKPEPPPVIGRNIVEVLRGIENFQQQTSVVINGVNLKSVVTNEISPKLFEFIRARSESAGAYESAVKVLSQSISK